MFGFTYISYAHVLRVQHRYFGFAFLIYSTCISSVHILRAKVFRLYTFYVQK